MVLATLRWLSLLVLLYVFNSKRIAADWAVIRSRFSYLLMLGVLGFTVFSVALYYALVFTTAINASILQGAAPLFVFVASFVMFSSRISLWQAIGFACSFAGVIVIAAGGKLDNLLALRINVGDVLVFVAVLAYGIYTAALRTKPKMHWTSLMFVLCLGASLSAIPMLAVEAYQGQTIVPDAHGWMAILYIIIFPSLLGQVFYIRSVELIGANRAGLFINLLPMWGAILAVTVVGEKFYVYHGVALALIMAGIALAEYGGRKLQA